MSCPRCRAEVPGDAEFCPQCGAKLIVACARCGTGNAPQHRFCKKCGQALSLPGGLDAAAVPRLAPDAYTPKHLAERILTSRSALEGERKQVTVLFADLKGSMELLADRDPEEARKILDPVLERMMEAVHHFEGTVNQVMGDGIMALFGAPLAHEDHAVRACYAALRMQESVGRYGEELRRGHGLNVQIRIGLNSGEVVVRAIGSDLHMDYTAVGQTTHLAARMEQLAAPGTILLTADTLPLVEGFVRVKPLGPVPVKGLEAPVEVYEVTGTGLVRRRLQAAAIRGLTRFIGRNAELEALREAQAKAHDGHGQVVAVVGEPGVGKSRLLWEFVHSHRMQGWLALESGSVSYGKATAYLPVIDLLKAYFKIHERDDAREIREKVTGKVLTLDRALEGALPPLLLLLDLTVDDPGWQALDPRERRERTVEGVRRLLLRESQVQPLCVVFEDLHWIDSESQLFLDRLIESLPGARVLLLVNYRPEYGHGWGSKTYYTQLRIDPLSANNAEALLGALVGEAAALAPLRQLLMQRTEGNPFFLEETVRSLAEIGVLAGERGAYRLVGALPGIQVPATVQAVLAARIDRLAPDDKRLLQAAAVIGKDVPFALLQAIAETSDDDLRRALGHLQTAEFVYETRLFPDLEYTFKHALTHEVAYASLLHERRRALHARIVEAIESLHRERLPEQVERLAHHAVRGELGEQAVGYLRQAGLKAASRAALNEAKYSFEQALAVIASLPERRELLEQAFDIRLELRAVLTVLGEFGLVLERLHEAGALAERLHDDRRRGRASGYAAGAHVFAGDAEKALESSARALAIAARLNDPRLRLLATIFLEQLFYYQGEYEKAVELTRENLAAWRREWQGESFGTIVVVTPPVWDRLWLANSLGQLGRFVEAAEIDAEMMRLAEATLNPASIGAALLVAGTRHFMGGDFAAARRLLQRATALGRAAQLGFMLPMAVGFLAWVVAEIGDTAEALERLREGEELWTRAAGRRALGFGAGASLLQWLACGHFALGRRDDAGRLAEAGVESAGGALGVKAWLLRLLGDIATHGDAFDADEGVSRYREALALAEPRHMRPLIAHCHTGLARVYRRLGEPDRERQHLETATTMYREMGMTFWLEKASAEA